MSSLKNSFKLQNTDWRWYRDKYLAIIAFVSLISSLSLLWDWPPPHSDLVRGLSFLTVAAICVVISPQRYFVLIGVFATILVRGIVASATHQSIAAVVVATLAGLSAYLLLRLASKHLSPDYKINDYSYAELAIDAGVLGLFFFIYSKLS